MSKKETATKKIGEVIISILERKEKLPLEELIEEISLDIKHPDYSLIEEEINDLIQKKKVWISIETIWGKYTVIKTNFSLFKES